MLTVVCEKTILFWVFTIAYKRSPVRISQFILIILKNEKKPCRLVRVDKYGDLEKLTDITNRLVDELSISMETTYSGASWVNGNDKLYKRIINNMVREYLIVSIQHENKWCCSAEIPAEVYRFKLNSSLDKTSTHF